MSQDPYDEMRSLNSLIVDGYIKDPRLGGDPRPPVDVYPQQGKPSHSTEEIVRAVIEELGAAPKPTVKDVTL